MRIYAIGDIHGKRRMLAPALEYLRRAMGPDDYAVFLGDYIDRGEDSKGVLDDLIDFREHRPDTLFLRGNHEELFFQAIDKGQAAMWLINGGDETLDSYGTVFDPLHDAWRAAIPQKHLDFLRATHLEHRSRNHIFVHAGLAPAGELPAPLLGKDPRLWIRREFIESDEDFGGIVVFGHTPQPSGVPLILCNKVGLDTGAAYGGRLSVGGFDDSRDYRQGPEMTLMQVEERE